jgi:hypothetical protein
VRVSTSRAQVRGTHGDAESQTIVENCGNTLILRCSASERGGTAEFASRLIGQREVIRREVSLNRPTRIGGAAHETQIGQQPPRHRGRGDGIRDRAASRPAGLPEGRVVAELAKGARFNVIRLCSPSGCRRWNQRALSPTASCRLRDQPRSHAR